MKKYEINMLTEQKYIITKFLFGWRILVKSTKDKKHTTHIQNTLFTYQRKTVISNTELIKDRSI